MNNLNFRAWHKEEKKMYEVLAWDKKEYKCNGKPEKNYIEMINIGGEIYRKFS